jgi:hypothetical protein
MIGRIAVATCATLLAVNLADTAGAAPTLEQKCQKARLDAAATYASCHQKVLGKYHAGSLPDDNKFVAAMSKCALNYQKTWPKLQGKLPGTSCAAARLVDNGPAFTDNLTGLQWERKTDDSTVHDKDNLYSWTALLTPADGTVYTSFLSSLNGGCFAGQCDWRLPTLAELQTIVLEAYPCTTSPCVSAAVGPTAADYHWSSTSVVDSAPLGWLVDFSSGFASKAGKTNAFHARAVRAGL